MDTCYLHPDRTAVADVGHDRRACTACVVEAAVEDGLDVDWYPDTDRGVVASVRHLVEAA